MAIASSPSSSPDASKKQDPSPPPPCNFSRSLPRDIPASSAPHQSSASNGPDHILLTASTTSTPYQPKSIPAVSSSSDRLAREAMVRADINKRHPTPTIPPASSTPYVGSFTGKPMGTSDTATSIVNSFNDNDVLTEGDVAKVVAQHLVCVEPILEQFPDAIGSVSHQLQGGDITREIYKWAEQRLAPADGTRQRRNSDPIPDVRWRATPDLQDEPIITASSLREPGMFRRHYVTSKARRLGRQEPSILTKNFVDFLALFGYYGGDVTPDSDDTDDEDGHPSETAPLLPTRSPLRRSNSVAAAVSNLGGTSAKKTFFLLMKAFIGTGVLFLPKAFAEGGLVFSSVVMIGIGGLTLHCMILLVDTSRTIGGSFGDLGYILIGPWMRDLVLWSIALSQMGFCTAYFIYVAKNLRDLTMLATACRIILPDIVFIVLQLAIYVPLSFVRRIKGFAITSLVADVFILLGLAYIFTYDISLISLRGLAKNVILGVNVQGMSVMIGTSLFAFEGIALIVPVAEAMRKPSQFPMTLTCCIALIGTLFLASGVLGYAAFGDKLETVIWLNMPKSDPMVLSLQFLYALAILLSFPLTVYPSIRITEDMIFPSMYSGKTSPRIKMLKNLYRTLLVTFMALLSYIGSNQLDKIVALVGSLACIPLSFIYPAVFHLVALRQHDTRWRPEQLKDAAIVIFGMVMMVYNTFVTLSSFLDQDPDVPIDRCR
ncbi:hypothetical protein SeLEV6574_g02591 [Synchytrium endobioticum]|nr:hypothetical protein SeLEV6574_g02591 [Synchytrium endobioticum]